MPASATEKTVRIPVEGLSIEATLHVPDRAVGVVVFAWGSGEDAPNPRNAIVSEELEKAGLATLDFGLLTEAESAVPIYKFSVGAPAKRLGEMIRWAGGRSELRGLPIGIFSAGTGTSAALVAAAEPGSPLKAIVSRGGRPEFAGDAIDAVRAPTLFIIGGHDWANIDMNDDAVNRMKVATQMEVVPNATHPFEEEGVMEAVARLARDWFGTHLPDRT
ncbi:MAG: alpha/beta hydrolase [Planctomycetes bacterium]|nr:alpha/beta hydrolase [Planctomycetota bacterium]